MFDIRITDRTGAGKFRLVDFANAQVEVPLNDSRLSKFDISMYSEAVKWMNPLEYLAKIMWNKHLVFWGPIVLPSYNFEDGIITVNAHDPTWYMKHRNYHLGYDALNPYPINGAGALILADPVSGYSGIILGGADTTPSTTTTFWDGDDAKHIDDPDDNPDANGVVWVKGRERGDNVWDAMVSMTEVVDGPDIEFQPLDADHPTPEHDGLTGSRFVQMNVFNRLGVDRSDLSGPAPAWHYGWGSDTLAGFTIDPDASTMINYAVTTDQGGQLPDGSDASATGIAEDTDSQEKYGFMEHWGIGGNGDKKPVLQAISDALVATYKEVTYPFTLTPKPNTTWSPQYLEDFNLGDTIKAVGKKGNVNIEVIGRIMKVTIDQSDEAGNDTTAVEVIPSGAPTILNA